MSSVPSTLRAELQAARVVGWDFQAAWPSACRVALTGTVGQERSAWRAVLDATEGDWRDAYNADRAPRPVAVAAALMGTSP